MRAVVFERNGGPEVLEYKEVPDPSPRAGEVVVDVEAVGVNFRDVYEREGRDYGQKPPAIVGVEGAGKVVGTDERVAWMNVPHSYAERVAANRDNLVPIPDGVSFELAAAALLQGITAHYLAFDSYPIREGDWVIVHAAAGGVGLLLTQHGSLYVQRPTIQTYTRTPDMLRERAGQVFDLIRQGKLEVRIGTRYPLAQGRQAHTDLEARKTTGKILLIP